MTIVALFPSRVRCNYRPLILVGTALLFLVVFWFGSRYPALMSKYHHVGKSVATMAYGKEAFPVSASMTVGMKILLGSLNWLDSMKIGMTFGILFGALLHTALRYYPLKIGKNLYLNSLTGAMIGVPMGVCVNCAVPTACGITRGRGRLEVALGFLFSSPNFNPVVIAMSIVAFPLAMVVTKYAILLAIILVLVPRMVGWLEQGKSPQTATAIVPEPIGFGNSENFAATVRPECSDLFGQVFGEMSREFLKNAWALLKPTVSTMVAASVVASALLVLIPWHSLLANATPAHMALASFLSAFMPVPIALDVMFAAQLQHSGAAPGYVMMFLTTLGTFSVLPSIYLWREVSKTLAVSLFILFAVIGYIVGLAF